MKQNEEEEINMYRDSPWPGNMLSNFAHTPFVLDGIKCTCSESFIQSLKFSNVSEQKLFCSLQGQQAWEQGSRATEKVFSAEKVWWLGKPYSLHSSEHFALVKRGLLAKFMQSSEACDALMASGNAKLTHDYGQVPGKKQSLPVKVFCEIMTNIRSELCGN